MAECRQYFGSARREETVVICDDCFKKMHPENHPHLVEQAVAEVLRQRECQ